MTGSQQLTDRRENYSGLVHGWVSSACLCHLKVGIVDDLQEALTENVEEARLHTAHTGHGGKQDCGNPSQREWFGWSIRAIKEHDLTIGDKDSQERSR